MMIASAIIRHRPLTFLDRGFSNRTIDALVARGIDAPEHLLFATEAELKKIPGIGKASLDEIMCYRARYIPGKQLMRSFSAGASCSCWADVVVWAAPLTYHHMRSSWRSPSYARRWPPDKYYRCKAKRLLNVLNPSAKVSISNPLTRTDSGCTPSLSNHCV